MNAPFLMGRCLGGRALRRWGWVVPALLVVSVTSAAEAVGAISASDSRVVRLQSFFRAYHCPGPLHIADYLRAADTYGIDYRLLPAVSVRESTCGRYERENNRWGWNSARTGFATVALGIEFVARQLAFGRSYRGKSLDQKLRTYNPNPLYAIQVKRLMHEIEAD